MDFEKLKGNILHEIGRAGDMMWISIGNPHIAESHNGKKREIRDFGIHFQCQWRFVKAGKILLASHDIYDPYDRDLMFDDNWDWDVFGREKMLGSVYDEHSRLLRDEYLPLKIENVYYTSTHDLHIDFDKDIHFCTFITCSTEREYYRFLDSETSKHTVIFKE
ncbi:MAG: hypothetical protein FWC78_05360 [Defluviitaleaceae bacterium]|nr:hypothetical protein [Defluviitaleaceae bacterium]